MPVKFSCGLAEIGIAGDVVAIATASGFMAADLHGHRLRYTGAHQVSHSAASEIVPEHSDQSGSLAGG